MDTKDVLSPKGHPATLHYREDTSDLATIGSTWRLWGKLVDEYGLAGLPELTGTAIDIGAHVGSIALALLADHPNLRVIAVEPLIENCAVMEASAEENGWSDRLDIRHAGIGRGKTLEVAFDFGGNDYLRNMRYIGGMASGAVVEHATEVVQAARLSDLVTDACPFLKVDCEGCEWDLLADKAIRKVERIVGEGHSADWLARVHKALDKTHDIVVLDDRGGPGTFRADLR